MNWSNKYRHLVDLAKRGERRQQKGTQDTAMQNANNRNNPHVKY